MYDISFIKRVTRTFLEFHVVVVQLKQHFCDIVSNGYNIVPTLMQHCVALKIVVANRPV